MLAVIFVAVYLGILLGGVPGLKLDRTGVALLGAIAVVAFGYLEPHQAWDAIDTSTIGLLLGLMVVSAQLRLGGFYGNFTSWLAQLNVSPAALLGLVVAAAGLLSALLCNDVVCLAMAPILAVGCLARRWNPLPFLLALACAANVGSAATLIGNPQVMLIGQMLELDFGHYLLQAAVPSLLGLIVVWALLLALFRGRWELAETTLSAPRAEDHAVQSPPFDLWQTAKGFLVLVLLVAAFIFTAWPREILALGAAGVLLVSRKMHTRDMLGLVDWQLLVLFASLFIVNAAAMRSGQWETQLHELAAVGIEPSQPAVLFTLSAVLSNLVSNVPAVMLLLPLVTRPHDGVMLALSSTLAGNLLIIGSIANIIVVEQAKRLGIPISWREHARAGIPITLLTLAIAAVWLYLLALWG